MKRLIIWKILFAVGLIMLLFRTDISRYAADLTSLLVAGTLLSVFGGAGVLSELYFNKSK